MELYAAVLDGACVSTAIEPLARAIGASSHAVHLMHYAGSAPQGSRSRGSASLPAAVMADYAAHWIRQDPWAKAAGEAGAGVVNFARVVSAGTMGRSAIWNDWARPRDGAFHCMSALVRPARDQLGGVAFHRRQRLEAFGSAEQALLERLYPALRRALLAEARLDAAGWQQAQALGASFAALRQGAALLDRRRRLVLANPALEAMAAEQDGLSLAEHEGLAPSDPVARQALARAIGTALAALDGRVRVLAGAGSVSVPRRSGGTPWLVQVLPVPARDVPGGPAGFSGALLLVSDAAKARRPGGPLLRQMFGLTPAEASLAAAIAGGRSPAEHAAARGVSRETVKTQLAALRRKTGARSGAELAALLARLDPP